MTFLIAALVAILIGAAILLVVVKRRSLLNFFRPKPPSDTREPKPEDVANTIELPDPEDDAGVASQPAAFFPDKPSRRDYLDFNSYAETLATLIAPKETQTPLTVGIFGAWGSGKTTLMRMIESSLKEIEKQSGVKRFVFVRFDAWKYYKEDALWRTMLLKVLDALRNKSPNNATDKLTATIERLEESLYRDVEWKEKGGLTIDWPKLVQAGAGGALKLSFSFVPGLSMLVKAVEAAQSNLGAGKLAEDVSGVATAFQRDMVIHHQSQLRHIEQFQNEFHKLVKENFADQRLVIFVDDLDRCLPEKAIEVLEAIKLFLDVEGCVFILGIDEEVITRGLAARYREAGTLINGQELSFSTRYIEKLIQLPFHLPPIEAREMRSYINLLNVAWPHPDCAHVFAEGLSPNPRQIKRTINVFLLLWRLAEKRRSSLGDSVTPLRLAKVVILQTAHPRVFEHIKSDARLLKHLENLCCKPESLDGTDVDPVLTEAVKQPSLKKLFQLPEGTESASFAGLDPDELAAFFSLARRAPLVSETVAKESPTTVPPTGVIAEEESRSAPLKERPFQLRASVRDFVGRNEQFTKLINGLRTRSSIGVVTGMAGSGKTEFALRVAEQLHADYPDGQLFVDMQGTDKQPTDPSEALSTCIRALAPSEGQLPTTIPELALIYHSRLSGKRVLIMLDNAANAAQVSPLIPPKGSTLLVTSRNALILPGMIGITLDQLTPDEAIALLLSITRNVPRDVAAEICSLCGYLPLAVRAAASTLATTPDLEPAAYADQLRDMQKRLEALVGTEGVNLNLEASFSLSYLRLPTETASVFRKLAVFPDTFDANAEETICEDANHSNLSELARRGLVFYDTKEGRYRTHSLMRLFAQRQLEKNEDESYSVGRSHAAYYLKVFEDANARYSTGSEASIEGLALYDRERENINAGFRWSAANTDADEQAASFCSAYATVASQIIELRKLPRTRVEWFTKGLQAARSLGNKKAELTHLIDLGRAQSNLGETSRAIENLAEAFKLAEQLDLLEAQALILSNLGLAHRDQGEITKAIEFFERQLSISRELAQPRRESAALVNMANAFMITGDVQKAIECYENALAISRQIADLQAQGVVLGNLGRAYNRIGDTERGLELCRQQLAISQKLGDRSGEAAAHFNIGVGLSQKIGKLDEALVEARIALQIYQQLESRRAETVKEWLTKWERNQET